MDCLRDSFQSGVVLNGRYQTISPLNSGSFGMVFKARDLTNDQIVAVKCLTKRSTDGCGLTGSKPSHEELELACHARLGSHPNIVSLLQSFETEAHIYLVLEYCSLGDLYENIKTGLGPNTTEQVREFMLQLVDAVAYMHSKGMYHRDIKPENIFLAEPSSMKLGDFGLATNEVWTYETGVGSDRYMSPEQYDSAGAGYQASQADIWAIGICMLNILFSRNPFTVPSESDPLFLDFSRDGQSLFDVFPTMSQDTYEVLSHCMSLDPKKRSLSGVRESLLRAVTFTTIDEEPEDFITLPRPPMASANREPLRTPSLQSAPVEQVSFPWAKALHTSPPQAIRQLSAIPDVGSYSEDLFPSSEASAKDWFSIGGHTPVSSLVESSLAASMHSIAVQRPFKNLSPPRADLTPISGSLPISMAKPKPIPSISLAFGKRADVVAKSWNDMYDEDLEDLEEEKLENDIKMRQAQNARTYSHESSADDVTVRQEQVTTVTGSSLVETGPRDIVSAPLSANHIDSDMVNDGFFFQDTTPRRVNSPPRTLPSKQTTLDKWTALGDRRRAATSGREWKMPETWRGRRNLGMGTSTGFSGFGAGAWDFNDKAHGNRAKGCPWDKDRDQHRQDHRKEKEKSSDLGDLEWVGGWQDSPGFQL